MRRFLDLTLSGLGAAVLLIAVFVLGPELETRFFPVYSKFEIERIRPIDATSSEVVFRYTKYRECAPQGFSWYMGEPGAAFRQMKVIPSDPDESPPIRPLGKNLSVPYVIDATPDQIRDRTFGEIFNRCHFAWSSRSVIYP